MRCHKKGVHDVYKGLGNICVVFPHFCLKENTHTQQYIFFTQKYFKVKYNVDKYMERTLKGKNISYILYIKEGKSYKVEVKKGI